MGTRNNVNDSRDLGGIAEGDDLLGAQREKFYENDFAEWARQMARVVEEGEGDKRERENIAKISDMLAQRGTPSAEA